MKYTGRVLTSLTTILITLGWTVYLLITGKASDYHYETFILLIIIQPLVWWLGKQYDKAQFYQKTLESNKKELDDVINSVDIFFWSVNPKTGEAWISSGVERLYGYTAEEFANNPALWKADIHPDDIEISLQMERAMKYGKELEVEYRIVRSDGEQRWILDKCFPTYNIQGDFILSHGFVLDITERKMLELDLKETKSEFQTILDNINACIYKADNNLNTIYSSKSTINVFGVPQEEFLWNASFLKKVIYPEDYENLTADINALLRGHYRQIEYRIIRPDNGEMRWIEDRCTPVFNDSEELVGFHGVAIDITKRKEAEEKVKHLANHDALTGLPNRLMFHQQLQKGLARSKRNKEKLGVMFIDLDRFKFVNDTMGHGAGDNLLMQVSARLVKCVREGDVVARQGGDEFIILVEKTKEREVSITAKRILELFSFPFTLNEDEFYISPSIGISVFPKDGEDVETLMKNADKAMYLAKGQGKNNYQFYVHEDESILSRKIKLERGLKRALVNKELELHYQPKVVLNSGDIYGVEALLRWNHPELGRIPPTEFIPIAEEIGMIIPIGKWVLEEACIQNKIWQDLGIKIMMNVNISSIQFEDSHFVDKVKIALAASQMPPKYLGLEITESVMQNINRTYAILEELKAVGVKVAIDDFGTGYSSLSVLNNLPIDLVKIDKSFVNEILTNSNTASLVKTMVQMGENIDFDLVAEGIEEQEQVAFLVGNGCKFGQGYFFSPPLPVSEVESLLIGKVEKT
ncbi:bifunctional diguanylate cyclase/phosphodiesterase [Evansella tamaricis]|uniref:EAL domain-containing protein n=1 Tax=Evansella tamaricis TaxID=2069301 RepID=A0ABS6JD71_9BACI|nr:bifunctional diguanylate cyclase/phosphodiesterase [Evansella tamaricis]MBU9711591.1 EAL domain-containing protein [Evansella tamaricis]